jgi:hypothetical protein
MAGKLAFATGALYAIVPKFVGKLFENVRKCSFRMAGK